MNIQQFVDSINKFLQKSQQPFDKAIGFNFILLILPYSFVGFQFVQGIFLYMNCEELS